MTDERLAQIRELAQTRTKTWAYVIELRLYICGVCDYAGDTEDELEEHDCHVSPPEEEKA